MAVTLLVKEDRANRCNYLTDEQKRTPVQKFVEAYQKTGDKNLLSTIYLKKEKSVEQIAYFLSLKHKEFEKDDLFSAAVANSFEKAVNSFDSSKCDNFDAYFYMRMRWAMQDYMRKKRSEMGLGTRGQNDKLTRILQTKSEMEQRMMRPVTELEAARIIGPSYVKFMHEEYSGKGPRVSLDQVLAADPEGNTLEYIDAIESTEQSPDANIEKQELREIIRKSINKLPKGLRAAARMRFIKDMALSDIGKKLGVTESRISQKCKKAVENFKVSPALLDYFN